MVESREKVKATGGGPTAAVRTISFLLALAEAETGDHRVQLHSAAPRRDLTGESVDLEVLMSAELRRAGRTV